MAPVTAYPVAVTLIGGVTLGWLVLTAAVRCQLRRPARRRAESIPPPDGSGGADVVEVIAERLGLGARYARLVVVVLLSGLGVALIAASVDVRVGTLVLAATFLFAVVAPRRLRSIERSRLVAQLPDGLESIARALRSGMSMRQALTEATEATDAPLDSWLGSILATASNGSSIEDAANQHRGSVSELRIAATAISMAAASGGRPALALDGVGQSLRDRSALRREIGALTSQAHLSSAVLALLPVGFLVVSAAANPSTLQFLLHDEAGRLCLAAGLALDIVGVAWMRALVRRLA